MSSRLARAVTPEQKDERRKSILRAAEAQLRNVGFESFSMEVLARELAWSRGTLYRYFGTREEVLLQLYNQQRAGWTGRLKKAVKPGTSDLAFVRHHYTESTRDPLFLVLRSRLETVIMQNISEEKLRESRATTVASNLDLSRHYEKCLGISLKQAQRLIIAYGALLLGAVQVETRPVGGSEVLTKPTRTLIAELSGKRIFETNALFILQGLRNTS